MRDDALLDLAGALVDGGDAHVAAHLLHHVLAGVAVAAQGLDGGVGGPVARLGAPVLGDGALGAHVLVALVDAQGGLLHVGPAGGQVDPVVHQQLEQVAFLLDQRARRTARAPWRRPGPGPGAPGRRPGRRRPPSGACSRRRRWPASGPGPRRRR